MLRVGLTGGIGSGKSAAAALFRDLGVPVLDLDAVSRTVCELGQPGLQAIVQEFGPEVLGSDGRLDRAGLGAAVFSDPEKRRRLEALLHPLILAEADRWTDTHRDAPFVILEVQLLFEAHLEDRFDRIVLVIADPAVRIHRLMTGRGMTEEAAQARIAAQLPDEAKRPASHFVLENNGSLEHLKRQVEAVYGELAAE